MFRFPPPLLRAAFMVLLGSAVAGSAPQLNAQAAPASSQAVQSKPVTLTAEQLHAARNLTPDQVASLKVKLQPALADLKTQIAGSERRRAEILAPQGTKVSASDTNTQSLMNPPQLTSFTFVDNAGKTVVPALAAAPVAAGISAQDGSFVSASPSITPCFPITSCAPLKPCVPGKCCLSGDCPPTLGPFPPANVDADQDGLPDALEAQLADNFTPVYSISGGEEQQFATFENYVPMTVASLLGPNTPYSYYRVFPIGVYPDKYGNTRSFLRIDYLTLWNADGGLPSGNPPCDLAFVGLDQVIQELSSHELDAERSGMYVSAPPVNGGLNPDPNAYSVAYVYTAAHEGTFFDASSYANYRPDVVPAGFHVGLALSLSKHSTYANDPDYFNLIPPYFISGFDAAVALAVADGELTDTESLLILAEASDIFYGCVVERFHDQGGSIARQRVNVGEPGHPINGSAFIQDNSARALNLTDKLTSPLPYY